MDIKKLILNKYLKNSLLLIAGLFLGWLFFYHSGNKMIDNKEQNTEKSTIWTCSMHPQIRMDKPGLCPICAMDLIPLEQNTSIIDDDAIEMTDEAVKLADIQTTVISKQLLVKDVKLYGKIQADERLIKTIPAHIPGRIEKLFTNFTGEQINKGQIIASIYSPELITAQQELFEALKLKDIQPQIIEAAKEKLKQWKLTDNQIEEIEKSKIIKSVFDVVSSVSGVIINRKINLGDYVQTGTPLFEVSDLIQLWGVFDAYENDLPWMKIGSKLTFTLQAIPGKEFSGNISFIDPVIDPITRIAKVRIELSNASGNFKPEMLATGIVKTKLEHKGNAIVVPQSAVLWTGKRSLVYVKTPNTTEPTFKMREVTLGNYLQNSYEIVEGLSEGEEVVTNGTFSVDAAAQLAGKVSMMNDNAGTKVNSMQEMDMSESSNSDSKEQKEMKNMKMDENIEHANFKVNGLCEMCKDRIESTSKKIPGVNFAEWNIKTKMLKLTFDKSKTNIVNIQKAIALAGHDNGKQIAPDEVYNNLPVCCKYRNK